jgi:hypothetical protein
MAGFVAQQRIAPFCVNRSCQRHTTDFPRPVPRVTVLVPMRSAVSRMIWPACHAFSGCCSMPKARRDEHGGGRRTDDDPLRMPRTRTPCANRPS